MTWCKVTLFYYLLILIKTNQWLSMVHSAGIMNSSIYSQQNVKIINIKPIILWVILPSDPPLHSSQIFKFWIYVFITVNVFIWNCLQSTHVTSHISIHIVNSHRYSCERSLMNFLSKLDWKSHRELKTVPPWMFSEFLTNHIVYSVKCMIDNKI